MTVTLDRRTALLAAAPLFAGVDAEGLRASPRGPSRSSSAPARSSPARARSGRASSSSPAARVRVVRDGETIATPRAGRVLRRAVGPRRPAAHGPGRGRRADRLPGPRHLGVRGGRRASEPAVALAVMRGLAARLRGLTEAAPALSRPRRRHGVTRAGRPARRLGDGHLPVQRHRGLDTASSWSSAPARTATSGSVTAALLRARLRGPRRRRAGHRGRLVLRHLPRRPRRGRRGGRCPARPRRRALAGRARGPRPDGPPHRRARATSDGRRRLRHQPDGAHRRRRPRRAGPAVATRPARSSPARCRTGVTPARPRRAPAQGPARAGAPGPARHRRACPPTSRRRARSTPGPTTCRPS